MVSSSNLCQCCQQKGNFQSFLRLPGDLPVPLHATLFFINITLIQNGLCLQKNPEMMSSSYMGSLPPQASLHPSRRTFETWAGAPSEGSCSAGDSAHRQQQHRHTHPCGGLKRCAGKRLPLFTPLISPLNADFWTKMSWLFDQRTTQAR